MDDYDPDDVDRRLVELLQENARYTAIELAEEVGVSDNTVHNRMERLESAGVITGYSARTDYDRIGLNLLFMFACTARISERSRVAQEALAIPQIVEVTELMTGERNLMIKAVGAEDEDITQVAERVDRLDLEIKDENLVRGEHTRPIDFDEIGDILDRDD